MAVLHRERLPRSGNRLHRRHGRAALDQRTAAVASAGVRRGDWPRRLRQAKSGSSDRDSGGCSRAVTRSSGGRVLARVGPYRTDLGRSPATRLMSCEDEDMFKRLLALGARGFYRPDLIVHHYVAPERVAKGYFRRWCFWRGVSLGMLDRQQPQDVAYLLGIPRYLYGRAARASVQLARGVLRGLDPARRFEDELAWWDLIGFVWGRHWKGLRSAPPAPHPLSATDQ